MHATSIEIMDREHGRRGLDRQSRFIVRAFCEALLSDEDERGRVLAPPAALVDQVIEEFDLLVGVGSLTLRAGMKALAHMVNRLPTLVLGELVPMTGLTLPERVVFLDALENSRVGLMATAVIAFKIPLSMLAYEQSEGLALMGFERPTIQTPRGNVPIPEPRPWDLELRDSTGGE
jgi:hypothetical protein